MGFERFLEKNRNSKFGENYIDYALLKEVIDNSDVKDAQQTFEAEIDRVYKFMQGIHEKLESRLEIVEKSIGTNTGKRELSRLLEDMTALGEFTRINTEGFNRILLLFKERLTQEQIEQFHKKIKKARKFSETIESLIYSAGRLKLKTLDVGGQSGNGCSFVRKSTKYWVHKENITSLKLMIAKHLPIYVFAEDEQGTPFSAWKKPEHDTCISSVYLDNSQFDLYYGRIRKDHNAEAIRIRWYGSEEPTIVFVERKRHQDNWSGESSNKLRFKLEERYVLDFLTGKDVWRNVETLNGKESHTLYTEVQKAILNKKLRPVVRTFYKRSAFQLPNDSSVRVSLDTNLTMIRECSEEELANERRPLKQWKRSDVKCQWPFLALNSKDIVRFPHGVLEVKIQGIDDSKPKWLEDILQSNYLEHVHKFSKFMHGCASLFNNINYIPYWMPQIKIDIRKDPYREVGPTMQIIDNELIDVPGHETEGEETPVHGKKIAIPLRVEPKVFFANERTFLRWIQFSIFLGGSGTTLIGFGDYNASMCGLGLIIVSLVFCFYALYLFMWRSSKIRSRDPGPYEDLYGPTILVIMFLAAMGMSIVFKYPAN